MWLTRISVPPLTLIEFFLYSRAISGADRKKLSIKSLRRDSAVAE